MEQLFSLSLTLIRSMRRIKAQQMRATRAPSPPRPPAELPLPQTSTLRSRKRLANILVIAGFIYAICWLPHVYCLLMKEFSINDGCSHVIREFFMLLGKLRRRRRRNVRQFSSWQFILFSLPFFSPCVCSEKNKRFRTLSSITNSPLDIKLQFVTSIDMSAIC